MEKSRAKEVFQPEFWLSLSKQTWKKSKPFLSPEVWDSFSKDYDELEGTVFYQGLKADILQEMEKRGALNSDFSLFDVCCGTGAYTIEFARRLREVYALDVSPGMLSVLRNKLKEHHLTNVKVIQADWIKYQPDRTFDTVFVSMTPILSDLTQVDRLLEITKRHLIIVGWAGLRKNELLEEISEKFLKRPFKDGQQAIVIIFNYLFTKGLACDLKFYEGYFERKSTVSRAWERFKTRLLVKGLKIGARKEKMILDFLRAKALNDMLEYRTKVRIGALFLNVNAGGVYGKS